MTVDELVAEWHGKLIGKHPLIKERDVCNALRLILKIVLDSFDYEKDNCSTPAVVARAIAAVIANREKAQLLEASREVTSARRRKGQPKLRLFRGSAKSIATRGHGDRGIFEQGTLSGGYGLVAYDAWDRTRMRVEVPESDYDESLSRFMEEWLDRVDPPQPKLQVVAR